MESAIVLTPKDFSRLLDEVEQKFIRIASDIKKKEVERPVTIEEAAKHLNVTTRTLQRWISSGQISPELVHSIGTGTNNHKRFFLSELNQFLKESNKGTIKKLRAA